MASATPTRPPTRGSRSRTGSSEDARLAQAELGPPRPEAFVDPTDLEPEQRALYRAAARGYLETFGDRPGRAADLGWRTHLDELGVDLIADVGLAIELPDGGRELRVLQLGTRHASAPLLDDAQLRFALVRTEEWAPDQLTIVAADVIEQQSESHAPDLAAARADARVLDHRAGRARATARRRRPFPRRRRLLGLPVHRRLRPVPVVTMRTRPTQ